MTEVVLIRPGYTDFDEQNRIQGSLDLPLNPRGRAQVDHLVDQLRDVNLDVIYSAPCEPARSTAEAIGTSLGIPVKEKEGLRNLNQGLWQGLQIDDIRRKFPKVYKQLHESPETICPPQGETVPEAVARVEKVLAKPMKRKAMFAVVASEPLATLIGCIVKHQKPELPEPMCGGPRSELYEVLETNGKTDPENGRLQVSATAKQRIPAEVSARGGSSQ